MQSLSRARLFSAGGYLLEVIAADERAVLGAIVAFVAAELGAQPVECSQLGRAQFLLRPGGASLAAVFRLLERNKARLQVRPGVELANSRTRHVKAGSVCLGGCH